jgi:hypothetical protein
MRPHRPNQTRIFSVALIFSPLTDLIVVSMRCSLRHAVCVMNVVSPAFRHQRRVIRYSFTTAAALSVSAASVATQCFSNDGSNHVLPAICPAPQRRQNPPARVSFERSPNQHTSATLPYPFPEGRRAGSHDVAGAIQHSGRNLVLMRLR